MAPIFKNIFKLQKMSFVKFLKFLSWSAFHQKNYSWKYFHSLLNLTQIEPKNLEKILNNCWNTHIVVYLEASDAKNSNLCLDVIH